MTKLQLTLDEVKGGTIITLSDAEGTELAKMVGSTPNKTIRHASEMVKHWVSEALNGKI